MDASFWSERQSSVLCEAVLKGKDSQDALNALGIDEWPGESEVHAAGALRGTACGSSSSANVHADFRNTCECFGYLAAAGATLLPSAG